MLHRIKLQVPEIRFLVTTGEGTKIDLAKLCDLIDKIPELPPSIVFDQLRSFRKQCLSIYTTDLDPDPKVREELWQEKTDIEMALRDDNRPSVEDSAVAFLLNPRSLKHLFRNTERLWKNLHGEIDFDDLFVATILRQVNPPAFEFLRRHRRTLHGLDFIVADQGGDERRQRLDPVRTQSGGNPIPVRVLLEFLAPNLDTLGWVKRRKGLQSIVLSDPTDYWVRLLKGDLSQNEPRDQEMLRLISSWNKREDGSLTSKLAKPDNSFIERFRHFVVRVDNENLLLLGSRLLDEVFATSGHDREYSSRRALIAILDESRKRIDITQLDTWLKSLIQRCLARSLYLADIVVIWEEEAKLALDLRGFERNEAQRIYMSDPSKLVAALDRTTPDSLAKLFYDANGRRVKPDELPSMPSPILKAIEIDPELLASQLAFIFVKNDKGDFCFDPEASASFFGPGKDTQIAQLFAERINILPGESHELRKVLEDARDSAIKWGAEQARKQGAVSH
jgi:hypothetical protein